MGPDTAADALTHTATGAAADTIGHQTAVEQQRCSSPQNSSNSTASGQQWPLKDPATRLEGGEPAPTSLSPPAANGQRPAAPDIDCCTPRSELSFQPWADKQHTAGSPHCEDVTAEAAPPQHGKSGSLSAVSAAHSSGLPNGAAGPAAPAAAGDHSQLQASPACGEQRSPGAQAAGTVRPAPAAAQPQTAPQAETAAKPAKRQGREDHLS